MKQHTVYEGEGVGLILGLELIREERRADGMIPIGIDNVAAIVATQAIKPGPSHYLWDIFYRRVHMVQNRHKGVDFLVKWTPGHMDIRGNEKADSEAKKAATEGSSASHSLPAPLRKVLPWSKSAIRQEFHRKVMHEANKSWEKSPRYAKLALMDTDQSLNKFAKLSRNLSRNHASLLFQLRSGHVPLNAYLYKICKVDSPICPSCRQHSETVLHYIIHCRTFDNARRGLFQEGGRDARSLSKLLTTPRLFPHLFRFIRRTERLIMAPEKITNTVPNRA